MHRVTTLVSAALLLAIAVSPAAAIVWNAASTTDFNWLTATNWDTNSAPAATDDVVLPTPIPNPSSLPDPQIIIVGAGSVAKSLTFNDSYTLSGGDLTLSNSGGSITAATGMTGTIGSTLLNAIGGTAITKLGDGTLDLTSANSYAGGTTLSAGTLRVGSDTALGSGTVTVSGAATLASTDATAHALANNFVLNADTTFGQATGGTGALTISGTVDLGAGAPRTLTVLNTTTLSGIVSNGALTKAGVGTLVLGNSGNTFTGTVTINGGVLSVAADGALGDLVNGIALGGGTLQSTATFSSSRSITFNAGTNGIDVTTGSTLTLNGVVGGTGGFTKSAAGTLILEGANSYGGTTTLAEGTLKLAVANDRLPTGSALVIGNAGDTGSATLDLNGFSQTVAGLTSVGATMTRAITSASAATLTVNTATIDTYAGTIDGSVALTKAGAGTLILGANNTYAGATTVSAGGLRLTTAGAVASTSSITVANNAHLELSGITINKAITISGNGGDFFGALRAQSGTNNVWSGNITLGADGARIGALSGTSLEVSGVIDSGANAYGLGLRGETASDTITLSGISTYLGGTQVIIGTVKLAGGNDRLPIGTVLTVGNSANQLSATFDLNGFNQTIAGLVHSGAMTTLLTNTSGTASTLTIDVSGANSYTYGTATSSIGGNLSIVKTGTGTQAFTGTNTFAGSVTINGGVLSIFADDRLGNAANTVTLGGGTLQTTGTITTSRSITLNAGANGINAGAALTLNGIIDGVGGFTKSGTGALTLAGNNSYQGNTTISSGNVTVAHSNAFGIGGTVSVTGSASRILLNDTVNVLNNITIEGTNPGSGNGLLQGPTSGSATYSGQITFNGNTTSGGHVAGGTGLTLAGPLVQGAGASSGIILRAGAITLSGTGSSYTLLRNTGATVGMGAANIVPTGATFQIGESGTSIWNLNDYSQTVAALILGGNSATINTGTTGVLTLNGSVTTSGSNPITINGNLNLGGGVRALITNGTTTPTIPALVTNGGILKQGTGNITLSNVGNTFDGNVQLDAGTLSVASMGSNPLSTLTLNGGTFSATGTYSLAQGVVFNAVTGNALSAGTGFTLTLPGTITGAGTFSKTGAGTVVFGGGAADTTPVAYTGTTTVTAGVLSLDKADGTNAVVGDILINGGVVQLLRSNQIPDTANITVSGGGMTWNNNNDTFANLTMTGGTMQSTSNNGGQVVVTGTVTTSGSAAFSLNSGGQWSANTFTLGSSAAVGLGGNTSRETLLTIGAGGLTLTGQTISLNSVANAGSSLGSGIFLGGNLTSSGTSAINVSNAYGSRYLNLGGVARTFDVTGTLTLGSSNDLRINNGSIVKTGSGTLVFVKSSGSTYNGLTINAGQVTFDSDDDLGATTTPVTINGGTLSLSGTTQYTAPAGRQFAIGAGGATINNGGAKFLLQTAALLGSGTITKTGASTLQLTVAQPDFSGKYLVSAGTLEITGTTPMGTYDGLDAVTLTGGTFAVNNSTIARSVVFGVGGGAINADNSPATAPTSVLSGTVNFANAGAVTLNDFHNATNPARAMTLSGKVTGAGAMRVGLHSNATATTPNTGALTLSNTTNDYSGTITVENGLTLIAAAASGSGSTLSTAAVVLAGGKLQLRDNGAGSGGTIAYGNNVSVVANVGSGTTTGVSTIDVDRVGGTNTGSIIQLGTLGIAGQQLNIVGANAYKLEFTGATTFTGAGGTQAINVGAGGVLVLNTLDGGNQVLDKQGIGTLLIKGPVNNLTSTTITAGTLQLPSAPAGTGRTIAIPVNTGFGAGWAATQADLIDRITLDSAGVVALGVSTTFDPNFAVDASSNPTVFTGGIRLGGSDVATLTGVITSADGTVRLGGGGGTLTLASVNAVSGTDNLDIGTNGTAPGTIVLAAANNFSGTVSVKDGMTLRIGGTSSLGTGTGNLALNTGKLQLIAGGDYAGLNARGISITSAGTVDTNGITTPATLGAITTAAATDTFNKTGAGTLILNSNNTGLTGLVVVAGGVLQVQNSGALGTAAANTTVQSGAALELSGGVSLTEPIAIAGTGIGGAGAIRSVAGTNTISGAITFTGAASVIADAGSTLTLGAAIATGAPVLGGDGDITISASTASISSMTKVGNGLLKFTADPNQSGTFTIEGGTVELNHSGTVDCNFVVNAGTTLRAVQADMGDNYGVTLNGTFDLRATDSIMYLVGAGTVTKGTTGAATLTVGTNSGSSTNTTFTGVIQDGTGQLAVTKTGNFEQIWTNANTFTGALNVTTTRLTIAGANASLATPSVTIGDNNGGGESLLVGAVADVWVTGALSRLADTATVTLNGSSSGGLIYNGPATGSSGNVETIGSLAVSNGRNIVTLIPGTSNEVQLTASTFTRANNGTVLIRGDNLGSTGVGSTRLTFTTAPTSAGGGGADGSTTKSILAWAVGDTTSTGAGSGFLTLGANGVRLLAAGEYDGTIAGTTPQRNISTVGGETVATNVTVNSLRITGGITTIAAGAHLFVNSGAVLFTGAATVAGPGRVEFGANDGIISLASDTAATVTIAVPLGGTSGLTVASSGTGPNVIELGGANTVVGTLNLQSGTLRLTSAAALNSRVPLTVAGPAGAGSVLQINGNNVVARDLQTSGGGITIQNGAVTDATLTTYLTAAQTLGTALADGGTGKLNLAVGGAFALSVTAAGTATGTTQVRAGSAITLSGSSGTLNVMTGFSAYGGTIRLTNTSSNNTNRIGNTAPIGLYSGTFDFDNNAQSSTNFSETVGALTLGGATNQILVDRATTSQTSTLTFASLAARDPGAVLVFRSQSNGTEVFDQGTTTRSRLVFTTVPTLDDGIIGGWAVVQTSASAREFAKYVSSGTISVRALETTDYTTTLSSGANTTQNVKITATPSILTSNTQINSLTLAQASATTVDIGGGTNVLRIESGGLIVNGDFNAVINNGTLTAGTGDNAAGELIVHVTSATANPTTIGAVVADNGSGVVSLTKAGAGVLALTGTNTYTGKTYLSGGTLRISSDANLGTAPASLTAGQLTIGSQGVLDVTNTMTLNANRGLTLLPGSSANIISIAAGTAGNGKTLTYNGAIDSVSEASLTFQSNATTTNVDPGKISATLSGLNVGGALRIEAGTVAGPSSGVVIIGRSFQLGLNGTASYTQTGGTLTVGAGINDTLDVGVSGGDTINKLGTLNLAGVTQFTANVDQVRFGVVTTGTVSSANSNVTLATNNDITAGTSILIGDGGGAGLGTQSMVLGSGVNTFTTKTFTLGGRKAIVPWTLPSGATLNIGGFGARTLTMYIGRQNVGTSGVNTSYLDVTNGTFNGSFDSLTIGYKDSGSTGGSDPSLTLGSGSTVEANTVNLGNFSGLSSSAGTGTRGFGTVNMSGGTFTIYNNLTLGTWAGTVGTAKGIVNLTGGALTIGGDIIKTNDDHSGAVITLNGAAATLSLQNTAAGDTTPGNMTLSQLVYRQGTVANVAATTLDGRGVTDGATFAALDNALILRDVSLPGAINLTNATANKGGILYEAAGAGSGGTLAGALDLGAVNRTITVENSVAAASDLTVSGAVTGTGGLTKAGLGTLKLAGGGSYAGTTSVSAGTLIANGAFTGTGAIAVASGATLEGTGTLAGAITSLAGTLAPGDRSLVTPAKGTLTIANAINLTGGATDIRILDDSNNNNDMLVQTTAGTITWGGDLNVSLVGLSTFTAARSFDLFDWIGTPTGSFANVNLPSVSGYIWNTSALYTSGVISIGPSVTPMSPQSGTWSGVASGYTTDYKWTTNTDLNKNWTIGYPSLAGHVATFGESGARVSAIELTGPLTVGGIVLNTTTGSGYTIGLAASPALTLDGDTGNAQLTATAGSHTIAAEIKTAAAGSGTNLNVTTSGDGRLSLTGALTIASDKTVTLVQTNATATAPALVISSVSNAGTLVAQQSGMTNDNLAIKVTAGIDGTGDTTVGTTGGATTAMLITEHIRQDVLTINAGSKVTISATGGASSTSVVNVLNIANSSGTFNWSALGGGITPAATGGSVASSAAVPEPATWLLVVMAALAGFVAWRRRK